MIKKCYAFVFLLLMLPGITHAQLDNYGKDFIMTFLPNLNTPFTELHLTAGINTTVTIEYPYNSPTFTTSVNLTPGTVSIVNIPNTSAQGWTPGTVENRAVHAFSNNDFVCYMINRSTATSDAGLALPVDVMNTEYIVATYFSNIVFQDRGEFAVVAGFDNTTVTITPSRALAGGHPAGTAFDIVLDRGEAFLGQSTVNGTAGDLTGTIINSDKPIGMTNGNMCTNVPPNVTFCDHIFEVAQPVQTWGNDILVTNLPSRPGGTIYRIIASQDNTTIMMDGASIGVIDQGEFIETAMLTGSHRFTGNKPIFVLQFMTSDSNPGADQGDPAMGNMIPSEQYLTSYTFSTVGGEQFERNYVNIIAQTTDVGSLLLDGVAVPAASFAAIAGTAFSAATIQLTSGTHTTASVNGHGITVSGFNNFDSYLYPGGARFEFINPVGDANDPICRVTVGGDSASGSASDNRPSEDTNNNDALDPGEDLNGNGLIDEDTGIFFVALAPGSVNLMLEVPSFVPGAGVVNYKVKLLDSGLPGNGSVVATDGAGNTCSSLIEMGQGEVTTKSFIAVLKGDNETPPVETDATGGGMFILNERRDTLKYWIRVCDLSCPFVAAHFHLGAPGVPGPVVKNITSSFVVDSGNTMRAVGVWTKTDAQPLTDSLIAELLMGNIYVNVHTTGHPAGEIRGPLTFDVPVHLYANLDGTQEAPIPVVTAGSGEGRFVLAGDGTWMDYAVAVSNLSAPIAAAHFHKAPVGIAGPVVRGIAFSGDSSVGTWRNDDPQPLTPQLVADVLSCFVYVNVHTQNYPGGEIRGQLYKTTADSVVPLAAFTARNNKDDNISSELGFYSLAQGSNFENIEGKINGYNGKKFIADIAFDIGGNLYFINNSWTTHLYRINPSQFDHNPSTPLKAKQIGKTRTYPDEKLVTLSNIKFIKGRLYGIEKNTNKLYAINPFNAYVHEVKTISALSAQASGITLGADGNVYMLKSGGGGKNELWKFNNFPSGTISLVASICSNDQLHSIAAHPNGNLYAAGNKNLYQVNLASHNVGVLKGREVDISAMDFNRYAELDNKDAETVEFESLNGTTDVSDLNGIPREYMLSQNYPNPFNPSTVIKYALPEAGFVKLNIYNSLGETVRTLVNDNLAAGQYETVFDASGLPSGVYICRIEAGTFNRSTKMVLLK